MFKKYIRNIVKEEINDIKLENTLKQLKSEHYWRDKAEREIKNRQVLVNHKNQIIIVLEEENEELKQEIVQLKEKTKWFQNDKNVLLKQISEQNEEIEELKDLYQQEKNKNYKTLESEELKQEIEKLQIKVDEYYNKFLSEGIKKEKFQELIRKVKKEVDLQGFYQDDFYSPEQTFYRIKNMLKES